MDIIFLFNKFKYNLYQYRLYKKWCKLYPLNDICDDGILKFNDFFYTNPKILFLLKEPADGFYIKREGPKGSYGPYGNSPRFWRHMRMWTFIVTEYFNKKIPLFSDAKNIREQENSSIAYVNIIKENDNNYTDSSHIENYVKNKTHKKLLKKQITIIKPQIILCGGTFDLLKYIFDNKISQINNKLYKYKKIIIIDYKHPSNFVGGYPKYFNELSNIVKYL